MFVCGITFVDENFSLLIDDSNFLIKIEINKITVVLVA